MASQIRFAETRLPTSAKYLKNDITAKDITADMLGKTARDAQDKVCLISALAGSLPSGHYNTYILFLTDPTLIDTPLCVRWTVYGMNGLIHYQSPKYYLNPYNMGRLLDLDPRSFWAANEITVRMPYVGNNVTVEAVIAPATTSAANAHQRNYPTEKDGIKVSLTQTLVRAIPIDTKRITGLEQHSVSSLSYIVNAYSEYIKNEANANFPSPQERDENDLLSLLTAAVAYASLACWGESVSEAILRESKIQKCHDGIEPGVYDKEFFAQYPDESPILDVWTTNAQLCSAPVWIETKTTNLFKADSENSRLKFSWKGLENAIPALGGADWSGKSSFFMRGNGLCSVSASALFALGKTEPAGEPTDLTKLTFSYYDNISREGMVDYVNLTRFPAFTIKAAAFILARLIKKHKLQFTSLTKQDQAGQKEKVLSAVREYYSSATTIQTPEQCNLAIGAVKSLAGVLHAAFQPRDWDKIDVGDFDFPGPAGKGPASKIVAVQGFNITSLQCALVQIGYMSAEKITGVLDDDTKDALFSLDVAGEYAIINPTLLGADGKQIGNGDLPMPPCEPTIAPTVSLIPPQLAERLRTWRMEGRFKGSDIYTDPSVVAYLSSYGPNSGLVGQNGEAIAVFKQKLAMLGYWSMDTSGGEVVMEDPAEFRPRMDNTHGFELSSALYHFQREHGLLKNGRITKESVFLMYYLLLQVAPGQYYRRPGYYCKPVIIRPSQGTMLFTEPGKDGDLFSADYRKYALLQKYYEIPVRMREGRFIGGYSIRVGGKKSRPSETDYSGNAAAASNRLYFNQLFGSREFIRCLLSASNRWFKNPLKFNDVSADHGDLPNPGYHVTHKYGLGIDLGGEYTKVEVSSNFDRESALELARALFDAGFTGMYSDCKYVCDNVNMYARAVLGRQGKSAARVFCTPAGRIHYHHYHVDTRAGAYISNNPAIIIETENVQPGWYRIAYNFEREAASAEYTGNLMLMEPAGSAAVAAKLAVSGPVKGSAAPVNYALNAAGRLTLGAPSGFKLAAINCQSVPTLEPGQSPRTLHAIRNYRMPLEFKIAVDDQLCPDPSKAVTIKVRAYRSGKNAPAFVSLTLLKETGREQIAEDLARQIQTRFPETFRNSFEIFSEDETVHMVRRVDALPVRWVMQLNNGKTTVNKNLEECEHRRAQHRFIPYDCLPRVDGKALANGAPVLVSALQYKMYSNASQQSVNIGAVVPASPITKNPSFAKAIADAINGARAEGGAADDLSRLHVFSQKDPENNTREYLVIEPVREAQVYFIGASFDLVLDNVPDAVLRMTPGALPDEVVSYVSPLWCNYQTGGNGPCPFRVNNATEAMLRNEWDSIRGSEPADLPLNEIEKRVWAHNYNAVVAGERNSRKKCYYHMACFKRRFPDFEPI